MLDDIKKLIKAVDSDNELYPLVAHTCKRAFDAFIEKGFTREEAIQLVIHYSIKQQ